MITLLTIVHVLVCLFLIAVVLLQSGRAGGMGVLSGAATQVVFGGRGAGNFLQKVTAVCAILFMLTCSTLAWVASSTRDRGLLNAQTATPASRPAATDAGAHAATTAATDGGGPQAPAAADDAGAAPSAPESILTDASAAPSEDAPPLAVPPARAP